MTETAEILKHGVISSVNPSKATARVTFADRDNLVSYDLPVLQHNSGSVKFYSMPSVGQPVLCLFLGTGMENGFIVGSFYTDENPPPTTDANIHLMKFASGLIQYDAGSNSLTIVAPGGVNITGNVIVQGDVVANGISSTTHVHGNSGGPT